MPLPYLLSSIITFLLILLGMAFFTLLERKVLGYIQIRKGPNKVGIMGLPQPFADALKLFTKEQAHPTMTNLTPFYAAPILSLILALLLWALFPSSTPSLILPFSILLFLCISSLNVYSTLSAGWSSNSKYALIGALRGVAQTISYEVSMSLILLSSLFLIQSYTLVTSSFFILSILGLMILPMFLIWLVTMLAETNRTPFDHAEGESELVSGFNTEYSSGPFALIFMAEYTSILAMSMFSAAIFTPSFFIPLMSNMFFCLKVLFFAFSFIWIRGTLPRMRYDRLMNLTWKTYLPCVLAFLVLLAPLSFIL
uniref:NADH-ubiquinone oxidoreductase chain 1 n=1 Tax=Prionospio fallax TaxID=3050094 RepID=A0AAU6QGR9_9ANNE